MAPWTAAARYSPRQIGFAFGIALISALLQRSDTLAYSTAYMVVSVCTLSLAAIVFALLRKRK